MSYLPNSPLDKLVEKVIGTLEQQGHDVPAREDGKYREYGCGSFGCVFPTTAPGVALKIAADGTEAVLAKVATGWDLEGLVHYFGADAWDTGVDRPRKARYAYLIYREDIASPLTNQMIVERAKEDPYWKREFYAGQDLIYRARRQFGTTAQRIALRGLRNAPALQDWKGKKIIDGLAAMYGALTSNEVWYGIGVACLELLEQGFLFWDFNEGNFGVRQIDDKVLLLLDVGLSLPLKQHVVDATVKVLNQPGETVQPYHMPTRTWRSLR